MIIGHWIRLPELIVIGVIAAAVYIFLTIRRASRR
jgi:hypothetical protein